MSNYPYTVSNGFDTLNLKFNITNSSIITKILTGIQINGTSLVVTFSADLETIEETELTNLVTNNNTIFKNIRAVLDEHLIFVRLTTNTNVSLANIITGFTFDGIVLDKNDIIFLKNQTDPIENGIYLVKNTGPTTRTIIYDTYNIGNTIVIINQGTYARTIWICTNSFGNDILGINNITFTKLNIEDITSGDPETVGTANSEGISTSFSRIDHVHNHGNQIDPNLHATVTGSSNGFMTSTDKNKLDESTTNNTASTLVQRDANGMIQIGDLQYRSSNNTNILSIKPSNSGFTTSNSITLPIPTTNDSIVLLAQTQTLTNKTLTAPIISTISNTGIITLPTSTDTLIGRATTDTLTNKILTNASCFFGDGSDTTKRVAFQTSTATTSTTTTFIASQTGNISLTLPTNTQTLVGRTTTDTLTNKTLITPVIAQIVNTGTLTLPTSTDTLLGRATTDTLTNKTIQGTTNIVDANNLKTTGTAVNVSSAAPPTINQILAATSATTATWQTRLSVDRQMASATSTITTTSTTFVTMTNMSLTTNNLGGTGTYMIHFSGYCYNSNRNNSVRTELSIGGTPITATERVISMVSLNGGQNTESTIAISYLATGITSGTNISVLWNVDGNTGTFFNRQLVIDGVLSSNIV